MSQKRFLPFAAWSLATWVVLAGAIIGLECRLEEGPAWWCLIIPALMSAPFLGRLALGAAGGIGRTGRVIFWIVTLGGAGFCVLLLLSQWDQRHQDSRPLAVVSLALPFLVAALLWFRKRRTGPSIKAAWGGWPADAAFGGAWLAVLICAVYFFLAQIYAPHVCRITDARWAAIGRPMPEFEKRLDRVEENASLGVITQDLNAFGIKSLYKPRADEKDPNTIQSDKALTGVVDLFAPFTRRTGNQAPAYTPASSRDPHNADSIARGTLYLTSRADDFNRLYNDVMRMEPPAWGYDPADGWEIRVPNYLALRILSQCIVSDACLKLQRGDVEGARLAASANLRLVQNVGTQPLLVSCMFHRALQDFLQNVWVRLPAEPDALEKLAAEVQTQREQLRTVIQFEYGSALHRIDRPHFNARKILAMNNINFLSGEAPMRPLREWLMDLFGAPLFKVQIARDFLLGADEVEITQRVGKLAATDLGVEEMKSVESGGSPGLFRPDIQRAWLRVNFALLLREQTEMIRWARAQMEGGKSGNPGDIASVVIPGSKWEIRGDAATNSFSLKLTPIPRWVSEKAVVCDDYFLLPLDGSQSWKLGPAPHKTAAAAP